MKIWLFLSLLCSAYELNAKMLEKDYRDLFCQKVNGKTEYRLEDSARIDCLNDQYAIEVEFAKKWAEGIGQSLYYAHMSGKKPAIALIMAPGKEETYLKRLDTVALRHGIKVFIIDKE